MEHAGSAARSLFGFDGRGLRMEQRKKWKGCFWLLLLFMLLLAVLLSGKQGMADRRKERREEELQKLSRKTEKMEDIPTETVQGELSYVSPIDFEALRRVNSDIVAWLQIPGTGIDYPVVQAKDNETYLHVSFEGKESSAGAVFLDCDSAGDFTGMHSILYGHHMRDGSMFAELVKFREESFFQAHREVILYLPERELHLRTIAALYGDDSGEKRRTEFSGRESFLRYVEEMTKNCSFRELPEGDYKALYSFVTCSYEFENARTILYAVENPEENDRG